jgi:DNA ligase-associated metallophosphoesterase
MARYEAPVSSFRSRAPSAIPITFCGTDLVADSSAALLWPAERTLVVADLHLEKASSLARRGSLLPPYDTRATLAALADTLLRFPAKRVVCLGDSFHDAAGPGRLSGTDAGVLAALLEGREWFWVCGNHDRVLPAEIGGERVRGELRLSPLVFRHEARAQTQPGEVSGHFHPKATIAVRAGRVGGRCFVQDERRLILPAFGALTGGLDSLDPAITSLFPDGFRVHLLGRDRVVTAPHTRLERVVYAMLHETR